MLGAPVLDGTGRRRRKAFAPTQKVLGPSLARVRAHRVKRLAAPLQRPPGMSASSPQHILVPHDFGEPAEYALSYALDLAQKLGARVTVVHAYEVMPIVGYGEGILTSAEMLREIENAARAALDDVVKRAARPGLELKSVLRQGSPWSEIVAAAKELHVELIVMATHGRHGLARALLGSVAEKVVRTAPCPVLTVHAPAPN
jgi:nucleotide-binding universal stress UspA family protein